MDFELSADQRLLRDEVRRFAEERIAPGVAARDRQHEFPQQIIREAGEMGLLGMQVPESFGGSFVNQLSYVLAIEELARICPATAVTVSVSNSVCCWPIVHFASDRLKSEILPPLASGEALGGFGLTEPGSGSDAGSLQSTAVRDGDQWVLNGEKSWITNAGVARYFVVMARTDPAAGKRGISAFVVPANADGLSIGTPEEKVGLKASVTAPLHFADCRIPTGNLIGMEGQGFKIALATLDHSRLGIAAQAIGIHQRALELARDYALDRVQFGVPIARHQAIQFQIAQMATELEAARVLTYGAALAAADKTRAGLMAAQAKLYASEAANRAVWQAVQIHGGNGFCEDYEIARMSRDVRITTIYEGTSEMQRLVIARRLLRS
jgi:alkylation response protein AidB-like acyl-CoA dehydrogenase